MEGMNSKDQDGDSATGDGNATHVSPPASVILLPIKQSTEKPKGNEMKDKVKTETKSKRKVSFRMDKNETITVQSKDDLVGNVLPPHQNVFLNIRKVSKELSKEIIKDMLLPAQTAQNIKLFGGIKAIEIERERSRNAGFVIHPCSALRQYWDLLIMAMLITNMFVLPLDISFFADDTFSLFHIISDALCAIDILFNFRTGYRSTPEIEDFILDGKKIAVHYFKTWFCMDMISTLPLHYILLQSLGESENLSLGLKGASRAIKFLKVVKLLNLLKLLRLSRLMRGISQYEEVYNWTASVMRYIKLLFMMLMVAHWNGCLHFLVPLLQDFPENCWIRLCSIETSPWYTQYGWALFKTLSHMLCIGYGRFIPMLLSEAAVTIFTMVTGATFYALFIAHSMAYIIQHDSSKISYQERFKQLEEYMVFRNLPTDLRKKVVDFYEHKYSQGRYFDEEKVLSEISAPLKDEIINYCCRDLVENVSFLRNGSPEFVSSVLHKLSFDVFMSGDEIAKEGNIGNEMYFIRDGIVQVTAGGGILIGNMKVGDHFGEISTLAEVRRVLTAVALTPCDLFLLKANDLHDVMREFPEMRVNLEHGAIQQLLDAFQKTQLLAPVYVQKEMETKKEIARGKDIESSVKDSESIKEDSSSRNLDVTELCNNLLKALEILAGKQCLDEQLSNMQDIVRYIRNLLRQHAIVHSCSIVDSF